MQQKAFQPEVARTTLHTCRPSGRLVLTTIVAAVILAGCSTGGKRAPVTDISSGGSAGVMPSATGSYVVKPGDTLYKVAQAHGMDANALMRLNNITDPTQLRPGQVIRLDSSTSLPAASGTATPVAVQPVAPVTPIAPTSTAPASDANLISWAWPASGKVIQNFNASTKGIDIEGAPGDPVHAAADGKVMYAGNGVRGLGNLILLGHSDGFITAYAHNQTLLVKTGEQIKKGAKIATIGQTDTTSPRLHFEVRRRGTPVNPMSYLPVR
ncbi:MAG: peptidoglycan DD-metalloendopeptidase family protein [Burkholderiaceae bacterium]|nr:peptidoglycan DD-metalloendopeptidase family protein [Burkholderiaceae bacterium]